MQIKVKDTKMHKPHSNGVVGGKLTTDGVLVAEGKLVLVDTELQIGKCDLANDKLSILDNRLIRFGSVVKPIIISETEKIEVGDLRYVVSHDGSSEMNPVGIIAKYEGNKGEIMGFKILVLPEQFSPKQLQDIIDGKMKDKVSVECDYNKIQGDIKRDIHLERFIKLNSQGHVTLHKIEEKMYTREDMIHAITYAHNEGFYKRRSHSDVLFEYKSKFMR